MTSIRSPQRLHPVDPVLLHISPQALSDLDDRLTAAVTTDGVCTGAVLLAAQDGAVFQHRAYGFLDPETGHHPTQLDTLFDLASLTKLFTATAFMRLVEEGFPTLDTPVSQILFDFSGVRSIGPAEDPLTKKFVAAPRALIGQKVDLSRITFRHLLTHTSGLAAWRSLYQEEMDLDEPPLPHEVKVSTRYRRLAAIPHYPCTYPTGTRMVYSDLGLILLGEAVAEVADRPLDQAIQDLVLDPLGLADTCFNPLQRLRNPESIAPTEVCAWRGRRCVGEVHDENAAALGGVAGHAGLFAPAWDVAVLGQLYLNQGVYNGVRLLSPQSVAEMTRQQVNFDDAPRGLGWMRKSQAYSSAGPRFGPNSFGHTGFTGTSLWVDPDQRMVVVLLTNRVYAGRDGAGILALRPDVHGLVMACLNDQGRDGRD